MELILPHGDYFYVGIEQPVEDEEGTTEVAGFALSWLIPPYETKACASFRTVIGRRKREFLFQKDITTYRPWVSDGLVIDKEETVGNKSKWPLEVYGENDGEAPYGPIKIDFVAEKFGASSLTLTFQWPDSDKRTTHCLVRVDGIDEFAKRLSTYSAEPVTFYKPKKKDTTHKDHNSPPPYSQEKKDRQYSTDHNDDDDDDDDDPNDDRKNNNASEPRQATV